ncbi:MAG: ParA family protein [Eubacterium sp.]|nr:ParA family protein [Eubacterium sp.]
MGEKLRTYNFINSVKGGVGKTTLSVFLANYMGKLQMETPEAIKDFSGNVMLLDLDLQGTAMHYLFEGNARAKDKGDVYLHQIILNDEEITRAVCVNKLDGNLPVINAIFSDDSVEAKLLYRAGAKNNYSSAITYNWFRTGLLRMLEELKYDGYKHFVFDMPPNFDGFVSTSVEAILRAESKENMNINMFFVTGMEPGQIKVTVEEVKSIFTHQEHFMFDNLFIVFNNNIPVLDSYNPEVFKDQVLSCQTLLNGLLEEEKKHIYYMYMPFHETYAKFNQTDIGLNHLVAPREDEENTFNRERIFPISPQTYMLDADKNVIYDVTDSNSNSVEKLLQLMLQK